MNWQAIADNLSEQIQEAQQHSLGPISPEQAVTNAQLTYTSRAFLRACMDNASASRENVQHIQRLCDAADALPITPYEESCSRCVNA